MEDICFDTLTEKQKVVLLKALDYDVDKDGFVLDKNGKPHKCPYTGKKVPLKTASILPGCVVVMNTSSMTLSEYMTDHVDV